jgi:acid ceramidase
MSNLHSMRIDLDLPPTQRWAGIEVHREAVAELVSVYKHDIGPVDEFRELLAYYRDAYVPLEMQIELDSIAARTGVDSLDLTLVNVYYDAFKHAMACTAFATNTDRGPLHARSLDWLSPRDALRRHSQVHVFVRGGEVVCKSLAWPGFIGVFTGVSPGAFAVSLNAVVSDDAPGDGMPVSLLLREALVARLPFEGAVQHLRKSPLVCDCLLLVSGTRDDEFAVVERTPTRGVVRRARGSIVATNDYRLLISQGANRGVDSLRATSDKRYDTACARVASESPADADGCLRILNDARVRMDITVQQAVMSAAEGTITANAVFR